MNPDKVKAVAHWKEPTTVKSVRSFLGFASYYRLFIKNFVEISRPLTNLTRKNTKFNWDQNCNDAFQLIEKLFTQRLVLATFNPEFDTQLEPDASGWVMGGTLIQRDRVANVWKPATFYSAKYLPAECNYDIHDKELLAVIKCIK